MSAHERSRSHHEIHVRTPYRLDLTVSVLRRLSSNVVDVLTGDGRYLRAFESTDGVVTIRARQIRVDTLEVAMEGPAHAHAGVLATLHRTLGVDRDVAPFHRAAARVPWLRDLEGRMRGVKPPRYPTLWEACVNAIVFQQVSLAAASTIARRMILALGTRIQVDGVPLYAFPDAQRFLAAPTRALRGVGLSAAKLAALQGAAEAIISDQLDADDLEALPSAEAVRRLRRLKGIGPWTAVVILLRGFGRLDVFPMNDTSVQRNLAFVTPTASPDVPALLRALEPQQGMLYYFLLLARLDARGEVARPSVPVG